jgi:hypothetical protein
MLDTCGWERTEEEAMGWLDKLLGRSKEVAGDVADTAGDLAAKGADAAGDVVEKGADVAGDAIDKGQDLAGDGVDKGKDLLDGDKEPPASAPPA